MNKILTILILTTFLFNFSSVVFAQTQELGVSTNETIALHETPTKGNQTVASATPAQAGTFAPTSGPQINIGFVNGTSKSDQVANTATPEEIFPLFIDPKKLVINGKTKGRPVLSENHPLDCAIPVMPESNFTKEFAQASKAFTGPTENTAINMSLYPNPSRGSFKVDLKNVKMDQILNIYNVQGVLVQSEYISADDSQRTFEFNLTNLENGMYIAELSSDAQRTTEQLLIQN